MKQILTIWKKELKDNIRDRRTLLSTIILPMLLMPLIIVGMGKLATVQVKSAETQVVKIGVVHESNAEQFVNLLRATDKVDAVTLSGDAQAEVKDRKVDLTVDFPDTFNAAVQANETIPLKVYRNSLNTKSTTALGRLSTLAVEYNQTLLNDRLAEKGLSPAIQNGIILSTVEVATDREIGGFGLGYLLPLFIIMWASVGGQYAAIDVSAGEKERKTLEALLMTPVRRLDVVFGKFLAVSTAALVSVLIALSSMYAVFALGGAEFFSAVSGGGTSGVVQTSANGVNFSLESQALLIMFGISILLVLLFSALNLTLAIFAKSYKEAQSYIGPSYLVVILPVVLVNTLPGFQPALGYFAIPVVNTVLLFKEVLIGTYSASHILLTAAVMTIMALAAIIVASRIYQKEGILFKD